MTDGLVPTIRFWAKRITLVAGLTLLLLGMVIVLIWRDRPDLATVEWPQYPLLEPTVSSVTMTWFGNTTVLFDDGETQLLIDGFFSRPSLFDIVLRRPVDNDAAAINAVLDEHRIRRLAAIIPAHSHFDHAMDIGAIANRSNASVLGSASSANIARGAGVPDDQIIVADDRGEYVFGEFTVTMFRSVHAPVGWGGSVPYAGTIDTPLQTPAPTEAWREGGSFSILIDHPQGSTLVHPSAGFIDAAAATARADVVLLGVGLLDRVGKDYAENYWQAVVTSSGAKHVFPVHFDDYTQPLGTTRLPPRLLGNFPKIAAWLDEFQQRWDGDTRLHLPQYGRQLVLFSEAAPEA